MDVIWFNRRDMPAEMFEIELSTDMLNSLTKFNELRDFYTQLKSSLHHDAKAISKTGRNGYAPRDSRTSKVYAT